MPNAQSRPLPLPGIYSSSGPCVRCGGTLSKVVRSGLAAYFCEDCWARIEARASGLDLAFHGRVALGRIEDD